MFTVSSKTSFLKPLCMITGLVVFLNLAGCTADGVYVFKVASVKTEIETTNKFVQTIMQNPVIYSHLSSEQKTQLQNIQNKVNGIVNVLNTENNDKVVLNFEKGWSGELIDGIQELIEVALPIAKLYSPKVEDYLSLGNELITILEALIPNSLPNSNMYGAALVSTTAYAQKVNAQIYKGP